ncbi:serine protease [Vibrio parahaemolyticus]|nr:serine protease [Vibrio parahaemolyticus]
MKLFSLVLGIAVGTSFNVNASDTTNNRLYMGNDFVPFANNNTQSIEPQQRHDASPFIIGGSTANQDTYSFHARIVKTFGSAGYADVCGGSVINDSFILTAAHCVMDYTNGAMTIDSSNGGVIVKNFSRTGVYQEEVKRLKNIYVHPLFTSDSYFIGDIAVIELEKPIVDNISSMPVATMADKSDYDLLSLGEIIGLGYTDDSYSTPDFLQKNSAQLKSHAECGTIIGSALNYNEVICIKGTERTCQGDSGGSLLYYKSDGSLQQIGVTSYGYFICEADSYSVFTETAYYESWVNGLVTHGSTLMFDSNGDHNNYHSFGDNNFVYSRDCDTCQDTTSTSGGSGGGLGIFGLGALLAFTLRRHHGLNRS